MNDTTPTPSPTPAAPERPRPIYLRKNAERHAHVAKRMKERGGLDWTPAMVLALEKKIRLVRFKIAQMQPVAPVLPKKIAETHGGNVHHYRVFIHGQPHTFVLNQVARGLVSYIGPGEILTTRPKDEVKP